MKSIQDRFNKYRDELIVIGVLSGVVLMLLTALMNS